MLDKVYIRQDRRVNFLRKSLKIAIVIKNIIGSEGNFKMHKHDVLIIFVTFSHIIRLGR